MCFVVVDITSFESSGGRREVAGRGLTQGKEPSSLSTHFPANGVDNELTQQLTFELDSKEANGMDVNFLTSDHMLLH